jgi:hypothetical protein
VTSVVYESCLILIEKYVLVFRVRCGFSVDFSFVTVFSDRSLDPDFLGHNFSVAHPIYFDFLSSGVESSSCPCTAHTGPACPLLSAALFNLHTLASVFRSCEALCSQDFQFPIFHLGVRLPLLL